MNPGEIDSGRPAWLQIRRSALRHNLAALRLRCGSAKIMAVVKAQAYGHGLVEAAREFAAAGADYFGVALVEEGIALRNAGIQQPIHVFGGIYPQQIEQGLRHGLELTASSADKVQAIDAAAARLGVTARVHLKIDTGMGRIGVNFRSARAFIEGAFCARHSTVVGVFSHFATADDDLDFARLQLQRFLDATGHLSERGVLRHMANSAAALAMPESHLDMVRCGLALYGVPPLPELPAGLTLRPALSLHAAVVYFKVVRAGDSVSYGRSYVAERDMRVVTVPIGYGDGFSRQLSNRASVLIRGKRAPIVGAICMDQLMAAVGPTAGDAVAYNGDEVVLIGEQGAESVTVAELAKIANTVPHEILATLNLRLPRRYVE